MSRSPEEEKALYEEALRLYEEGDLVGARALFERIVREGGKYLRDARYYLEKLDLTDPPRGPSRGRRPSRDEELEGDFPIEGNGGTYVAKGAAPDRGLPMSPPRPPMPPMPPMATPPLPPRGTGREAEAASVPTTPEPLRRTPHMDLSSTAPVDPGTRIQVRVYTDAQAFREGESGDDVIINAPLEQKRFEVDVWLTVGEPFTVEGPPIKRLVILRDVEKSEPVDFTVLRQDGPEPAEPVLFSALFSYKGRPCGRVSREMSEKPTQQSLPETGLQIDARAKGPDLSVRIVANGTDERLFDCAVETPLLPEYEGGVTEPWRLSSLAADLVREKMNRFTAKNATPFARTAALRGAGIQFFEAAPKIFQKVFWELIDKGHPPRTISIVTEEPAIPWELMVPTRDGDDEDREPLGIAYLVSRWTTRNYALPSQHLPLKDAFVVAPRDSRLASAEEEVKTILQEFPSQRIDPAGIEALDTALGEQGRELLHFICHGKSGLAGSQVLLLDKLEELDASLLRAMPGVKKAFKSAKPFVFLNACEVGRQEPALVGAGGFAEAFMALGASGVIAPLWSVKDSIAHEIAEAFYDRVKKEPKTPFAQILADLRKLSYKAGGGEDTYAAYCFYGDPLARRAAPAP